MKRIIFLEIDGPDAGFEFTAVYKIHADGGSVTITGRSTNTGDVKVSLGAETSGGRSPDGFLMRPIEGGAYVWEDRRDPVRDRELDRFAVRDHVMFKALEDIAADCGGPILDAGSAAKRAAITLERIGKLLPGDKA